MLSGWDYEQNRFVEMRVSEAATKKLFFVSCVFDLTDD